MEITHAVCVLKTLSMGDTEVVFTAYKIWSSLINLVWWWNQLKPCVQTAAACGSRWCSYNDAATNTFYRHFLQLNVEFIRWRKWFRTSCNWFFSNPSPEESLWIWQLLVWRWCQSNSRDCVHKQLLFTFAREAKHVGVPLRCGPVDVWALTWQGMRSHAAPNTSECGPSDRSPDVSSVLLK